MQLPLNSVMIIQNFYEQNQKFYIKKKTTKYVNKLQKYQNMLKN